MKFHTLSMIVTVAALAVMLMSSAVSAACPSNPAVWCDNLTVAKECNVAEQCYRNVWAAQSSNDPVNFTLYYESLCPDCREFMGQLWEAFTQLDDTVFNLTIVPYGNARETWRNETKLWQFTCQHGTNECWGNLFHTCLIYLHADVQVYLPVVHCMEADDSDDIRTAANKCSTQFGIDQSAVQSCMNSRLGNQLQHAYAVLTDQLQPAHQYVPWVTLNGVHTEQIQQQAQTDLIALICDTYQGDKKPSVCNQKTNGKKCFKM